MGFHLQVSRNKVMILKIYQICHDINVLVTITCITLKFKIYYMIFINIIVEDASKKWDVDFRKWLTENHGLASGDRYNFWKGSYGVDEVK